MKKTLKVVSDIHGFYDVLINDLNKVGYTEDDNSLLIICGDYFDRGLQSLEVYNYIKRLSDEGKAICIRGNHESFIQSFLEGEDCSFNFAYNGFNKTINSFLGDTLAWDTFLTYLVNFKDQAPIVYGDRVKPLLGDPFSIPTEVVFDVFQEYVREKINNEHPELLQWLKERPYYYETKNYIFTHASIDGSCKDWHNPEFIKYEGITSWESLTWDNGTFYGKEIKNTNKIIVCGHYHTDGIREKFNLDSSGTNEILYSKDGHKIFIDTCTPLTRRVNVLTINNEELL